MSWYAAPVQTPDGGGVLYPAQFFIFLAMRSENHFRSVSSSASVNILRPPQSFPTFGAPRCKWYCSASRVIPNRAATVPVPYIAILSTLPKRASKTARARLRFNTCEGTSRRAMRNYIRFFVFSFCAVHGYQKQKTAPVLGAVLVLCLCESSVFRSIDSALAVTYFRSIPVLRAVPVPCRIRARLCVCAR